MTGPARLRLRASALAVAAAVAIMAGKAEARDTPSASTVFDRACAGHAGGKIGQVDLAKAVLTETGKSPTDWAVERPAPEGPDLSLTLAETYARMVRRLGAIQAGTEAEPAGDAYILQATMDRLEGQIRRARPGDGSSLTLEGGVPAARPFLFQPAFSGAVFACKADQSGTTFISGWEDFTAPAAISLRATPEELGMLGDERRDAGAVSLAFDRTRSTLDDGSRKTDTNLAISGTLGIRLTSPTSARSISYLYGRYDLSHARTHPAPALAPGASQSDGDTDALETGILLHTQLTGETSDFKLFLDTQAGAIFDFANDASRVKLSGLLRPVAPGTGIGLCDFERATMLIPQIGLKTRCRVQLEIQAAEVTKRGTTKLGSFDTFLAAGARGEFEAFLPMSDKTELLGNVKYRYLPVLHGAPDKIERLEAQIKQRFWTSYNVGIDVGFTYANGTNELSFEHENKLTFGLGIIY
ncbi:hypothetical protein NDN01_00860 [Sphingomonas sp. QA11]|uniref:hypothetical protein n=1 Tax=Sphingomonas sp. QA11 TaxID=2950605 RepID=UPI00234AD911|nr:hypothetical protein [Sphingomonas sp. QA11]WCM27518.1 hypothetical protein NDN01_00860 [Sphingomonas sp. QA11]